MKLRGAALLLCVLPACSVLGEGTGTADDAVTVTPEGPGGDITLTVVVPQKVNEPTWQPFTEGEPTSKYLHYFYGDKELTPGVATRLRRQVDGEGYGKLRITYGYDDAHRLEYGERFLISVGETKTLTLGAIHVTGSLPDAPELALTPYDASETLSHVWQDTRYRQWHPATPAAEHWAWAAKGPYLPTFAGHYEWTRGNVGSLLPFDVAEGTVATVDTTIPDPRGRVTVVKSSDAVFGPAATLRVRVMCLRESDAGGWAIVDNVAVDRFVSVYQTKKADCWWQTGNAVARFELEPKGVLTLTKRRLDVDDVLLTDEAPGTKVPGTYTVEQKIEGQMRSIGGPYRTKTGLDLVPGTYHLTTKYKSLQGNPQTAEQDVTLD